MFCVYLENRSVRNFSLDIFIRMFIDPPYLPNFMSLTLLILLFVSWNELTVSREEVHTMRKHTPSLNSLDMRHNPWSKKEGLRVRVIGRLVGQKGGSQSHDNREVSSQKMRNSNSGVLDSESGLSAG